MTFDEWFSRRYPFGPTDLCQYSLREAWDAATVAERGRCASCIELADPVTTYQNDSTGEEWEVVDWSRTAESLARHIREGVT